MNADVEDLSILLHIAHGTGLNIKDGNIVLVATLGGHPLETKPVQSSEKVEFDNNLIWETNKRSIKRMKTENLPIKLECFVSNIRNGQEIRNLIGYILIPIKGVPIVLSKRTTSNKPHWHKLVGLNSDWKIKKPEVSLYLSISDKVHQSTPNLYEPAAMSSSKPLMEGCYSTVEMLSTQKGLYIELLQKDGLLQVGDKETNCDIFILKLLFKNAKNLEHMINSEEDMHQLFRFNYNLLGTPAYFALTPKGNGTFSIQEKIAINFRTSIKSLKEYFLKVFHIPVELFYNDSIVGSTLFNFNNILQMDTLSDFLDKYSSNSNTFTYESTFPIQTILDLPPSSSTPYIEFVFSLKYMSTTIVSSCEIIMDKQHKAEYIDNNGGDKNIAEEKQEELEPTVKNNDISLKNPLDVQQILSDPVVTSVRQSEIHNNNVEENNELKNPESDFLTKTDIKTFITEKCSTKSTKEVPRTFSFNLILETVKFNRRPDAGIWQISLHHQNADTTYAISNVELTEIASNLIEFQNLVLQLYFSSNVDNVFDIISSESCVLKINGPRGIFVFAELDNEVLLLSTKEKRSGIILMENQSGEKCAMAHIFVYIEDMGITFNSQIKKHSIINNTQRSNASHLDENLAYRMVEELEDWKQKQQENFLVELKRREINHLAMLSIEWQKRKSDLENELTSRLEHCTQLSDTLEEAHRALNEKGVGVDLLEHEKLIEKVRQDSENKFSKIIIELNEKIRRVEEDMKHQIKLEQLNYKQLELEKLNMEKEKISLQQDLDELQKTFNEMKRNHVPREQLVGLFQDMNILHERLEDVQKSQQFYKGQWAKVIRELHKIKLENLQKIEGRIGLRRVTDLQNLLQNEKDEFYNEREQLNEIKAVLENSSDDDDCESFYEFEK